MEGRELRKKGGGGGGGAIERRRVGGVGYDYEVGVREGR